MSALSLRSPTPMSDSNVGDVEAEVVPYIIPSHTIANNDSKHIAQALRKWRPASRARLLNAAKRRILIEIRESDAAAPNMNLIKDAEVRSREFDTIIAVHQLCLMHQLYLVVGLVIHLTGGSTIPLVSLLFCVSRVLRSPGYWSTMLEAVPRAVKICLVVKDAGWSPENRSCIADVQPQLRTSALHSIPPHPPPRCAPPISAPPHRTSAVPHPRPSAPSHLRTSHRHLCTSTTPHLTSAHPYLHTAAFPHVFCSCTCVDDARNMHSLQEPRRGRNQKQRVAHRRPRMPTAPHLAQRAVVPMGPHCCSQRPTP